MDAELLQELRAIVGEGGVRCGVPLSELTTFRIGGPAECCVEPRSEDEVRAVLAVCRRRGAAFRVLGLGSDVLAADEGVGGVTVRLAENLSALEVDGTVVRAQAGCSNAEVARAACAAGLSGYEFACGIPGTVGGAAIMNAGAYGGEFKDVCASVRCLTPEGETVDVDAERASWSYRHSMMDEAGYIVLAVTLSLRRDDPHAVQERMDDLARRREEKQPLDKPSAGSTFKRPEGRFVGQLVQEAGLRGYRVGGAQVSEKHTGFVVNAGGATAADVRRLIADVQERVRESAGVELEPEVRLWGFEEDEEPV
ncbi:UDP-N-acetylenolpyruvoylglucosamine reductase [Gordonibacter sp. 28C]|uniref:UDP-N-acetylmuramate dehydrogenase n=1 Tax=Gordonibacter sp. 28C TaxID=2078569 RepID=UPI000DF7D89A|nr:UDP-N-acetylmuramate dehydrogenase [Gordonibacter sp. 28C]RDB59451.1 UDP-N-acetylenolpyruvoylglucosamine reductase [Gordonibacter sp. 28C]